MINLVSTHLVMGRHDDATDLSRRALTIVRRVLGDEHMLTLTAMTNLAIGLQNLGHYDEAEKLRRATLECQRAILGEEHPDTVRSMNNLAFTLQAQGMHEEAVGLSQRAVAIGEKIRPQGDVQLAHYQFTLAKNLQAVDRFEEAEESFLKSHESLRAVDGLKSDAAYVAKSIALFYEEWHAAEPGKGYDAKAAEWREGLQNDESEDHE